MPKGQQHDEGSGRSGRRLVWRPDSLNRTMTHHDAGTKWKMKVIREQDFGIDQQRRRGENPGVNGISLRSPKRSTSGKRSVEQPSCLSQRILDLGEVTNRHHLEYQPIDVGFEFSQSQGAGALPPSWLPGDRS